MLYIFINIALVILSIFLVFCGLFGKKFKNSFINKILNKLYSFATYYLDSLEYS